jgi:hypothetical protein
MLSAQFLEVCWGICPRLRDEPIHALIRNMFSVLSERLGHAPEPHVTGLLDLGNTPDNRCQLSRCGIMVLFLSRCGVLVPIKNSFKDTVLSRQVLTHFVGRQSDLIKFGT